MKLAKGMVLKHSFNTEKAKESYSLLLQISFIGFSEKKKIVSNKSKQYKYSQKKIDI